jgi:hypothetical protein
MKPLRESLAAIVQTQNSVAYLLTCALFGTPLEATLGRVCFRGTVAAILHHYSKEVSQANLSYIIADILVIEEAYRDVGVGGRDLWVRLDAAVLGRFLESFWTSTYNLDSLKGWMNAFCVRPFSWAVSSLAPCRPHSLGFRLLTSAR